jgi:hypothetical protein
MPFTIETSTDEPVADFSITAVRHVRAASVGPHDFEALVDCVTWLRDEVRATGTELAAVTFSATPDNPVTPTKVTFLLDWTPPISATQ